MNIYEVIKKPIISEKSYALAQLGKYCYSVNKDANKYQIINAFKQVYKVDVVDINIINYKGKKKVSRTKKGTFKTVKPNIKKAIIKLKKDQKISDFEVK
jgi:large subunit ribosomal protein L23